MPEPHPRSRPAPATVGVELPAPRTGREGEQATVRPIQVTSGLANNVLQPTPAVLVRMGLVFRPTRGVVAFSAPLFDAYLRRRGDDTVG